MKVRATSMLGAVTAVFLATTIWGGDSTLVGYVQATAEAAMVGGLADWFAVTAVFRHPLGIPIPHTAVVVESKNQFAATLGDFIEETFLSPDAIVERLRTADVVSRAAAWLRDEQHAERVAAEVLDGAVKVADLLRDDDVHRLIEETVRDRVDRVPLAPLGGRALEFLMRDGRHEQVLDAALQALDRYLDEHRDELRDRFGAQSPWWLPGAAEDRIFERLVDGARALLTEMVENPDNDLRQEVQQRLRSLAADLQTTPEYLARGEELKHELLANPQVRTWVASLWADLKAQLRVQASDPASELRRRLAGVVVAAGERLEEDSELRATVSSGIETAVTHVVERFHGEISELITGTIDRWDAEETADRLELLLGPDLQFIRINGTVVGACAGLGLHTVAQVL
jgi:uncharacterized membrane-anchored protein YjiN (DUF445 family)